MGNSRSGAEAGPGGELLGLVQRAGEDTELLRAAIQSLADSAPFDALLAATAKPARLRWMLEAGADPNTPPRRDRVSLLRRCVALRHAEGLGVLLAHGARINEALLLEISHFPFFCSAVMDAREVRPSFCPDDLLLRMILRNSCNEAAIILFARSTLTPTLAQLQPEEGMFARFSWPYNAELVGLLARRCPHLLHPSPEEEDSCSTFLDRLSRNHASTLAVLDAGAELSPFVAAHCVFPAKLFVHLGLDPLDPALLGSQPGLAEAEHQRGALLAHALWLRDRPVSPLQLSAIARHAHLLTVVLSPSICQRPEAAAQAILSGEVAPPRQRMNAAVVQALLEAGFRLTCESLVSALEKEMDPSVVLDASVVDVRSAWRQFGLLQRGQLDASMRIEKFHVSQVQPARLLLRGIRGRMLCALFLRAARRGDVLGRAFAALPQRPRREVIEFLSGPQPHEPAVLHELCAHAERPGTSVEQRLRG